jgi:hypothetical protein
MGSAFRKANEKYANDYPATVGPHRQTDSVDFMDLVPAISLRENERGAQIEAGSLDGRSPNAPKPSVLDRDDSSLPAHRCMLRSRPADGRSEVKT